MRRLTQEDHNLRSALRRWMDANAFVVFEDADSAAEEAKEMVEEWCQEWIEDAKNATKEA